MTVEISFLPAERGGLTFYALRSGPIFPPGKISFRQEG